ncbi:hypothetical protein Pint_18707 [Pistacia integerrima]|uniref:Uncharacterized protein n=1 Tax=Pistacia integerrima TaxID=434235 RepID=A0ACC0YYA1_9ROSI|nr:hypothetical protein Pint_18707 [Pistacia integerrima]
MRTKVKHRKTDTGTSLWNWNGSGSKKNTAKKQFPVTEFLQEHYRKNEGNSVGAWRWSWNRVWCWRRVWLGWRSGFWWLVVEPAKPSFWGWNGLWCRCRIRVRARVWIRI